MSAKHKERVITLVMIVALAIVLPPILYGEYSLETSNPYKDFPTFIYHFQAIIAGVLAVVAAYLTVLEMRRTDANSEFRHQQLLRLNVRADRLRFERLYTPARPRLTEVEKTVAKLKPPVLTGEGDAFPAFKEEFGTFSKAVHGHTATVHREFTNKTWASGADLFDGPMMNVIDALMESAKRAQNTCTVLRVIVNDAIPAALDADILQHYLKSAKDLEADLWAVGMLTGEVIEGLDQLAEEFTVKYWVGPLSARRKTRS